MSTPLSPVSTPISEEAFAGCHAILLAGGSGTRLWPLSRTLLPKQLLSLDGQRRTLLQQTAARALSCFPAQRIWVVTNEEHVFEVRSQLAEVDPALDSQVLAEPVARNTLPAILLALDRIAAVAGEEATAPLTAAVFPSDHLIRDEAAWRDALRQGVELARQGYFVTFGISPAKAETGYGYIERGQPLGQNAFAVQGFREKPDLATAQQYLASGQHFWNSGMFLFSFDAFLRAVADHTPAHHAWWQQRQETPLLAGYPTIPSQSVDYGIAEHIQPQAMVAGAFDWDDLGSWEAIYRLNDKDAAGNVTQGDVLSMDCDGSLLLSRGGKLAVVGVHDLAVVQTRDATLVCPLDQVQRVKDVVGALKGQGSPLVEAHVTVYRPWGSYTVLEESAGYKVKRIMVKPGARLSLQMHHHRSEHWVVIRGTALVEVGDTERLLAENQSVDIPQTTRHRLSNPGKVPVEIIEVQSGPYLGEDDIIRLDDVYGRTKIAKY